MQRIAAHFDAACEVRIVGAGTDLRLSLEGRTMRVDALGANLPGGEFFGCPLEDSAEGEISFADFPAVYRGREVAGIRLAFAGGRVVDASADCERGLPDADARHRRGRAPARRARDRLQPRHHPLHEEHALRREDGRHRPPRAREQLHGPRRRQRVGGSTGTSSRTCACRARGSSSTEPSCSRTAPGGSEDAAMEERIAASSEICLLPRCARILKPGTYGSP